MIEQFGVLFRSSRITFFKSSRSPSWSDFFIVLGFESVHVFGLCVLVFVALPELDVVRGSMITTCLGVVPMFLSLLSRNSRESHRWKKFMMDGLALISQFAGIITFSVMELQRGNRYFWSIPVSVVCISAVWWENFVDRR